VCIPQELYSWLANPSEDWSLPNSLLSFVQTIV
jgi:hypothetical protein